MFVSSLVSLSFNCVFFLVSFPANISTVDPDNELNNTRQSFTYRLLSTLKDLPFHIEYGKIRTRQHLNYEQSSTWNITVESRDSGVPPLKIQRSFIINVQGKLAKLS